MLTGFNWILFVEQLIFLQPKKWNNAKNESLFNSEAQFSNVIFNQPMTMEQLKLFCTRKLPENSQFSLRQIQNHQWKFKIANGNSKSRMESTTLAYKKWDTPYFILPRRELHYRCYHKWKCPKGEGYYKNQRKQRMQRNHFFNGIIFQSFKLIHEKWSHFGLLSFSTTNVRSFEPKYRWMWSVNFILKCNIRNQWKSFVANVITRWHMEKFKFMWKFPFLPLSSGDIYTRMAESSRITQNQVKSNFLNRVEWILIEHYPRGCSYNCT